MSISSSIIQCLKSFNEFVEQIRVPTHPHVEGLNVTGWEDELGRLRIWAANIGAHQTNQSSLDFRLRDASHIRDQIIELLAAMMRRLEDAIDVLAEANDTEEDTIPDDEDEELEIRPEMEQMQNSVATLIGCLFQMSMLIRKPAKHDLRIGSRWADVAVFEQYDINHVRAKCPRADEETVQKLGHALTKRRMYLKYRERHSIKLKQGLNEAETQDGTATVAGKSSALSDTVVTDLQDPNIVFDDKGSESGMSLNSDATSFITGRDIAVPPLPKAARDGQPFECPICYHIIKVQDTRSWHKHVFRDLQPYSCIDGNCATPKELFTTKHEWQHHMRTRHGGGLEHDNEEQSIHGDCPLCPYQCDIEPQLASHVASHYQELALFVLPGWDDESDTGDPESYASSSTDELLPVDVRSGCKMPPDEEEDAGNDNHPESADAGNWNWRSIDNREPGSTQPSLNPESSQSRWGRVKKAGGKLGAALNPFASVESEERRRKYKNEPRRKRLHFVKDPSSGPADERDHIHPRPRSHHDDPEMYPDYEIHQRRFENGNEAEDPRWVAHLAQQQLLQQQHQQQHQQHQAQMGWRPPQEQLQFNPHHGGGDEIIRVEEFAPGHDPHHPNQLPPPVVIEREPRVARMPSHVRARSRSRHDGHSRGGSSLFSDESSNEGSHGRGRRRREEVWRTMRRLN